MYFDRTFWLNFHEFKYLLVSVFEMFMSGCLNLGYVMLCHNPFFFSLMISSGISHGPGSYTYVSYLKNRPRDWTYAYRFHSEDASLFYAHRNKKGILIMVSLRLSNHVCCNPDHMWVSGVCLASLGESGEILFGNVFGGILVVLGVINLV